MIEIDDNAKALIKKFFDATKELKNSGITRSSKYLGDIGEYICKNIYELELTRIKKPRAMTASVNLIIKNIR